MPVRICFITLLFLFASMMGYAQADSIPREKEESLTIEDMEDYDELLDDLGMFLDSLLAPRSYFLANLSIASGYFNYTSRNNNKVVVQKKTVFTPTLGYYHKSGPGITASANMIGDNGKTNLYQYSITPSYDFIQSRKWTGGVSYTRYITDDSLKFYTTPLQNELSGYFLWRKSLLQPGLSASYGWGSRTDLRKRQYYLARLIFKEKAKRRNSNLPIIDTLSVIDTITTTITTKESIVDFLLTASLRHTFYWLELSGKHDYLKFTPMLTFSLGTQQFGFNQTRGAQANVRNAANVQFNRGDVNIDEKLKFQPLSLTLYLRPEYSIGKFYIQPQLMIDYYFPAKDNNFTTFFSINAGIML